MSVDELVNVLVPQSQVDFQSSVVPLVVRVPAKATVVSYSLFSSSSDVTTMQLKLILHFSQQNSQFSQSGEQSSVGLVLLEVVVHGLNDRHVIVKVSRPFADQRRKTLCAETQ